MKISVEDGVVVCSLEDKDDVFLSISHGCFKGYYNGKLKIAVSAGQEMESPDFIAEEIKLIQSILYFFYKRYLFVNMEEDAIYGRLKALRQALDKLKEPTRLELQRLKETEDCKERWKQLCEKGCGKCPYRKRSYEDNYCNASGKLELLDEKNVPDYVNGVHYLFKYEPFPSVNCIYKIN